MSLLLHTEYMQYVPKIVITILAMLGSDTYQFRSYISGLIH